MECKAPIAEIRARNFRARSAECRARTLTRDAQSPKRQPPGPDDGV